MSPAYKTLVSSCLQGPSSLCEAKFAEVKLAGGKDAVAFFKAFANGEQKKGVHFRRDHLISTARQDAAHLEKALSKGLANTVAKVGPALEPKPAAKKAKPIDGKAHIVKQDDLPSLAASIEFHQQAIEEIGRKAMQAALPLKLKQGLCCLKAQALYLAAEGVKGGRPKNRSESDQFSEDAEKEPASFNDWIAGQALAKASAYDYMRAVEGLGLDHRATDKQLAKSYEDARKKAAKGGEMLSIAKLKNLAKRPEDDDGDDPEDDSPEALTKEADQQAANWIANWDKTVKAGNLEHASKATLKKLHEFLTSTRDHVAKRMNGTKA